MKPQMWESRSPWVVPIGERVGRLALVILISVIAVWFTWIVANPEMFATDFHYYWYASRHGGAALIRIRSDHARRGDHSGPMGPILLPAYRHSRRSPFAQTSLRTGHSRS